MTARLIRRRVGPGDRAATPYLPIPFDVRPGETSLEVNLEYDDRDAVIDLGCESPNRWRGWSGGARRHFTITKDAATPGYLAGPLETGEWSVILGLHKVPHELEIEVTVSVPAEQHLNFEEVAPEAPQVERARRHKRLPSQDGMTWYAGDLHAHSLHSDGALSLSELAAEGRLAGLDFLAVTDHNTISHHRFLPELSRTYALSLVPGQEVTTARGHANALGDVPWVDFRRHPDTWIRTVAENGGVLSLNHPVSGDCSWQWAVTEQPTHAEVMHSDWLADRESRSSWAWWVAMSARIVPLGGSDFHTRGQGIRIGSPTTWVLAPDPSVESIVESIKAGRTTLSVAPDGPVLVPLGDETLALGGEGALVVDLSGQCRVLHSDSERVDATWQRPLRLETADRQVLAVVGAS